MSACLGALFCYHLLLLYLSMGYFFSSAADGPDVLSEELDLVKNMNLAIREERYNDAGMIERCSPIYYLLHFTL